MRRPVAEASGWLVATIPFIALTAERVLPPLSLGLSPIDCCDSTGMAAKMIVDIVRMTKAVFVRLITFSSL
jgi:hypothetical protein